MKESSFQKEQEAHNGTSDKKVEWLSEDDARER